MDAEREIALLAARCAVAKKAEKLVIMDVSELVRGVVTRYFVVCSGSSRRQVQAVAQEIMRAMRQRGVTLHGAEGIEEASWILLDYVDVVVHVFLEEVRSFYDLELLWGDAPRLEIDLEEEDKRAVAT